MPGRHAWGRAGTRAAVMVRAFISVRRGPRERAGCGRTNEHRCAKEDAKDALLHNAVLPASWASAHPFLATGRVVADLATPRCSSVVAALSVAEARVRVARNSSRMPMRGSAEGTMGPTELRSGRESLLAQVVEPERGLDAELLLQRAAEPLVMAKALSSIPLREQREDDRAMGALSER
jgi:hypothetical protein